MCAKHLLKIVGGKPGGKDDGDQKVGEWHPEFAEYMIEGMPKNPYGYNVHGHDLVSTSYWLIRKLRRAEIQKLL